MKSLSRSERTYRFTNCYKPVDDFDRTILLLPMNFSEIVAQQQTRCRRLLAAAVFSQQRQTQIFRKIFWSEVARTYVRVSTWLPLCALQLDKIDPFLSPGPRYTAVILVKRNFVERNSIFWDLSVCTTLHNASIGHFQG